MKAVAVLLASPALVLALAGCGPRDPVPTADSHQPENPGAYATGPQETRDSEEARAADSPNDDGKNEARDGNDPQRELPSRPPP
ncbi:MAG: hypothetical protein J7507_07865 [Pseudoxanthomonas sp.]|nr:hypothetical protein [Pseudoxanthomonas sp.]